jgi:hypothetical protein
MWGSHLSSGGCEQHTTRTTIVLAFWQIYDNAILIMFSTSQELLNCSILTSANAKYKNSALSPTALKQAPYLLCKASSLNSSWHSLHANNKYAKIAQVLAVELC